jgi:hypothetical protein
VTLARFRAAHEQAMAELFTQDRIGLRRFARRGLTAAQAELDLAATVTNLLKLYRTHPA